MDSSPDGEGGINLDINPLTTNLPPLPRKNVDMMRYRQEGYLTFIVNCKHYFEVPNKVDH